MMGRFVALILATVFAGVAGLAQGETWRFAVIGDIPYSDYERRETPRLLDLIAAEHPEFIVHAGDFKHSNSPCTDELFADRLALFNAATVPFIYTPGDNEWTDCRRLSAGHYDELERLDKLRELFFSAPRSVGQQTIAVEQQSVESPEHLRWRLGPVLFLSLNVPGPDNNFGMSQTARPEYQERMPRVIGWLEQGFSQAREENAAGVVVVMQGNPGFKHFSAGLGHRGYRELLETLLKETIDFPGQVLLIHGDTHWHRIDQPLLNPANGQRVVNFTRLETFGYPIMGWVKVIIDTGSPSLFRFESHAYDASPFPAHR